MFKELEIKNLNNHKHNNIDLSKRVNIISGENGQGKSTIANAIELCLTGYTRGSGDRSSNLSESDLIRQGQDKAEAELVTDLFTSYWKRTPSSSKFDVNDYGFNKTETQDFIKDKLGVSQEVLQAVFKADKFMEMDTDEKKQLLYDLLGLEVTQEKIKEKLKAKGIKDENYIEPIAEKLKEGIEEAEDFAVNQRRKYKRQAKDLEPKLAQDIPEETGYDVETIKEKLQERKDEKENLLQKKGRLSNPQEDLTQKKDVLSQELNELEEIELESDKTKDFKIKKINAQKEKKQDKINTLKDERNEIDNKIATLKGEVSTKKEIINKVDNLGGTCVVSENIDCPMKDEEKESVKEDLKEEIIELNKEIRSLSSKKGSKTKEINSLEDYIKELDEEIEEIKEKHQKVERKNKIEKELEEIQNKIEQQEQNEQELHEVEKRLNELNQSIEKGQEILEQMEKRQELLEAKDDYIKLQEKIENWDFIAKALGSNEGSIIDEILNEGLEPVRKRMNVMSIFDEDVELTRDIDIVVGGRKVEMLSPSELWRVNLIFKEAVTHFADLPFLIVDGVEILDQKNKGFLFQSLTNLDYEDIMIINTVNSGIKPDPKGPDFVQQWWVEEGQVSKIE
mgnify:CR=1 FL=1